MKRTLAMIGWLMVASASYGADGQHTGVGGNPLVPPPNSSGSAASPWNVQSLLTPSLLFLLPDWMIPEATQVDTSGEEESQKQADASSTQ